MFENGSKTQKMENNIYELDYDQDLPGIEIIENFDEISLFKNKVLKRAKVLGFTGETDSELVKFLSSCCKDSGAEISRQTISNWIKSGAPNGSAQSRENVYRLCFALKFDEQLTAEFFLKAYLEKPYNFKSVNECVYYFCLKNHLAFSEAARIIDEIKSAPDPQPDATAESTVEIRNTIYNITSEKKFKNYIIENKCVFGEESKTVKEELKKLIDSCMKTANEESRIYGDGKEIKTIDSLLFIIYGYPARRTEARKKIFNSSISKSRFPAYIKRNFPQRQQLENILKGKGSFDSIRKALVILDFYSFFGSALINKKKHPDFDDSDLFDDFISELNVLLETCGYIQMYWLNPFDWMIGYCAFSDNPIYEFRDLIEELYLNGLPE